MKNWQWAEIGTWRRRRALESERTWYGGEGLRRCRCTNSVAASRVAGPVPENAAIELPASQKVWDFGIPATFRRSFTAAHPGRTAGWYQRRITYTGYTPLSRQEALALFLKILQ